MVIQGDETVLSVYRSLGVAARSGPCARAVCVRCRSRGCVRGSVPRPGLALAARRPRDATRPRGPTTGRQKWAPSRRGDNRRH